MRILGLIGGMSWVSTATYYERINSGVAQAMGKRHSAPLLIDSLDFEPIAAAQAAGEWQELAQTISHSGRRLVAAGAEGLLICSNTMHKLYGQLTRSVNVPVLHIADPTAAAMRQAGIDRAALFGTRFTMNEEFLVERFAEMGVKLLPPDEEAVRNIDRIIFEELVRNERRVESQRYMKSLLFEMQKRGDKAVVLGCTELSMVVNTVSNVMPIYDSTAMHADAALKWILGEGVAQSAEPRTATG